MKKILLIIITAVVYLVSFKIAVNASSNSPYDVPTYTRDYYQGYFTDSNDTSGDFVLQNDANDPSRSAHSSSAGYEAILPSVNTAGEFINDIMSRLNSNRVDPGTANNAKNWDRTGAAFIIQTMIGTSRNRPPSAAEIADWQARVNHAAALGHINWGTSVSASPNTFYQINRSDGSSSVNDVAWYNNTGSGTAIVFYHDNGSVAYILRRQCANPIGSPTSLSPASSPFSISASSAVNDNTPIPGQVIQFTHTISANADTNGGGISWTTQNMPSASAIASGTTGAFGGAGSVGVGTENYTVPLGTAAGTTICRRVTYSPASDAGGSGASGQICATVQYDYNLNPTVSPSSTNAQDGDTITFTYRIENTGGNASVGAQCYVRDAGNNPVAVAGLTCAVSQAFPYNSGVVAVGSENVTITGQTAGTKICRTLYIQPATPSVANRASTQSCVVVAKVPYVRFSGNDIWAGGGFPAVTPACNISAKITTAGRALPATVPVEYAGSSVEYNAFALNRITSFGSAGKVLVGSGALGDLSRSMTFANNEASTALLGYYGASQHCLQDYSSLYSTAPTAGLPTIPTASNGAWRSTSPLTLSGAMPAGSTKVYYVQGDVTISGNITYPASYANYASIPSLLVIATGNIYVAPGVTQLDGQYVTRGTFYTCYPKPVPNSVSNCNGVLTVNGSVVANTLDLYRTAGGDGATVPSRQAPAEVFNFVPEVYIRNVLLQTAKPSLQILNSLELPPRF